MGQLAPSLRHQIVHAHQQSYGEQLVKEPRMNPENAFGKIYRVVAITSTAALLGVPQLARADVVTDWNTIAVNTTVSAERVNQRASRDMAMVHAAMFDAMNA